jgi:hypothetical protein
MRGGGGKLFAARPTRTQPTQQWTPYPALAGASAVSAGPASAWAGAEQPARRGVRGQRASPDLRALPIPDLICQPLQIAHRGRHSLSSHRDTPLLRRVLRQPLRSGPMHGHQPSQPARHRRGHGVVAAEPAPPITRVEADQPRRVTGLPAKHPEASPPFVGSHGCVGSWRWRGNRLHSWRGLPFGCSRNFRRRRGGFVLVPVEPPLQQRRRPLQPSLPQQSHPVRDLLQPLIVSLRPRRRVGRIIRRKLLKPLKRLKWRGRVARRPIVGSCSSVARSGRQSREPSSPTPPTPLAAARNAPPSPRR